MSFLAFLVLLTESLVSVPPSHWTAIKLDVPQARTTVHGSFRVEGDGSRGPAIVLSRGEAERFNRGRSIQPLYMSGFVKSDSFHVFVPEAGDYVLLLDNRLEGRHPTPVKLRFDLSYPHDVRVQTVSWERKRVVVALSLFFFGAVVTFSAAKFLRNGRNREQPPL